MTCSICGTVAIARGLCPAHYAKARRDGELAQHGLVQPQPPHPRKDPEARFLRHLTISAESFNGEPCILWGTTSAGRYARFYPDADGPSVQAHRWSYERYVGPISDGLVIDHLCCRTFCVNPRHLEPVTQLVNMRRYFGLDEDAPRPSPAPRLRTHCKRGHELTPENVYRRPDTGRRQCRSCIRLRNSRKPLELMAVPA